MSKLLQSSLLGVAWVALPALLGSEGLGPPLLTLGLSVGLAGLVDGRPGPRAIASGALGGLGLVALGSQLSPLGGALFAVSIFAARLWRAPTPRARALGALVVGLSGAAAALVATRWGGADEAVVRGASVLVCAALLGVGFWLVVDDARTAELRHAATRVEGPLSASLERAVELHRQWSLRAALGLDARPRRDRLEAAWVAFSAALDRRLELAARGAPRSALDAIDARLVTGVESFVRIARSLDAQGAAGPEGTLVESLAREDEALAAETEAWREIAAA
ncbi:MAG: hypothetical protein JNK72_17125 [Myxococcales bacterium]|nr:hypothetical protein [Myxococcales bacterium]